MKSVVELKFSQEQSRILSSVMPGGKNWHSYEASEDGCLKTCPYFSKCLGSGPDKICSDIWDHAEPNPDVLSVLFHVLNNFEHYNRDDIDASKRSKALAEIRLIVSQAQAAETEENIDEGTPRMRMHRFRERKSVAAQQIKAEAISRGHLVCMACDVDFLKKYKQAATRIVECHHSVPLSSVEHRGKTHKKDLLLLCANCHRLAHSAPDLLPLEELRRLVTANH